MDILTEACFKAVSDLSYSTTEVPGFTMSNKSVRLDLRCTGEDGTQFIVEMQCYRQANFFRRCVEYAAKVYDSGSRRGDRHEYDLAPVYFIGLLNVDVPKFDRSDSAIWADRYVSEYTFREKVSHEVVDETIFIIFMELNRFDKALDDCESQFDKWCYALKHVGTLDSLPDGLRIRAFERLFEACEISKFTPEEKLKYEHDMMSERDYDNIIYTARTEGEAKGLIEGKTEVARAMKSKGLEISLISEMTGLSEEEIRGL